MNRILLAVSALLLCQGAYSQSTPGTIKETKKVFKTYDYSDPDPIARPGTLIYPYYRFDGYTKAPVYKEWKVVELENDYIKVMILPEIGGKIWAAWEKSTGKPFIYYNQVVKFRNVAMRGPWTSGGIEANYGIIGHTPNCATPVDYLTETNEDGSVSCTIGTLDLLTQTRWNIEIRLPRDKAYFTTRSFWHNSTPTEQPYYSWMNAGIKVAGNLEFIYPGNRYLGHLGEYSDWNINRTNGKIISYYDQNDFGGSKSYHVFGQYTDFFGVYWHNEDFGMGHYSAHDEKAGKKIWIWGLSRRGMIWEDLLTDTDGQYAEVQSGRLFNQGQEGSTLTPFKHRGFAPATSDAWTEYWFPVKDIKGYVQANPFGALNIRHEHGRLMIDFCPLQDLATELKVFDGDQLIYSKLITLKTLTAFADSIAFQGNPENLTVTLGDTQLKYSSNVRGNLLKRPVESPGNFDWQTVQGLHLQGKENIRQRFYPPAEEKLLAALGKDPNYLPALTDLAMLMFREMDYRKSLDYALHALSIDTYDAAANYYYGLSNAQLGNLSDAKDGFDIAALSGEYRGAAYLELSKIYFKDHDMPKALHYAGRSLETNSTSAEAYQIMAVIYRRSHEWEKAKDRLEKIRQLNPLNHFTRFEEYLWMRSDTKSFTSLIRNEMPHETHLQLADWYLSLGLVDESLKVLDCAPANAEVYYWMAYLKNQLGADGAAELLERANSLSPAMVFPFRSNSARVLEWVISLTRNWKPKYYLGLIHWSRNNLSIARELFAQCDNADYAPFYASRAMLFNNDNYAGDMEKAAQLDPGQWRYGNLLTEHFIARGNYGEALAIAENYHRRFARNSHVSLALADTLLLNGKFKACSDLLEQVDIIPFEGAIRGRQLYREAWLMQAVAQMQAINYPAVLISISAARRWPENLGVGKPYDEDIDARLEDYLEGICLENTGSPDQALKKWEEVISRKRNGHDVGSLVTALALRQSKRDDEGLRLLSEWVQLEPDNKLARWCAMIYQGDQPDGEPDRKPEGDEGYRIVRALLIAQ
jgi:tetratricopeptide (TPR) repeat protein